MNILEKSIAYNMNALIKYDIFTYIIRYQSSTVGV